jgi:HxlR-like helix-turn-helix
VLDRVSDKWVLLVIGALERDKRRFSELRRDIGDVSQKMLTKTLRSMERDGSREPLLHRVLCSAVEPCRRRAGGLVGGRPAARVEQEDGDAGAVAIDPDVRLVAGAAAAPAVGGSSRLPSMSPVRKVAVSSAFATIAPSAPMPKCCWVVSVSLPCRPSFSNSPAIRG